MVGKVQKAVTGSYGLAKKVYVKPMAESTDLRVVTIVKRSAGVGE